MTTYYPINENLARASHDMRSMSTYPDGYATREYRASVDKAAALVEEKKQKVSPYYHEKLDALLDSYARRLAQWTDDHNRNGASCPSVLVCGAGNFPVRKKQKQNAREDTLWHEYEEIEAILTKIKAVGTGPVDLADPPRPRTAHGSAEQRARPSRILQGCQCLLPEAQNLARLFQHERRGSRCPHQPGRLFNEPVPQALRRF